MIGKITIAMNLCVKSWYYISDFELELLENVLDSVALYVEKMHVKELKELLLRKKVSLKGSTVKAQFVAK